MLGTATIYVEFAEDEIPAGWEGYKNTGATILYGQTMPEK